MQRSAIGAAMTVCGLCLASVMGSGGTAFAQDMEIGVKGGVNLAKVQIDSDGDDGSPALDWRIGGVAGLFITLPVTSWLELQPEALYAMKGTRSDVFNVETTMVLDYFEVPVLARVTRGRGGARRYYVAGGPSFGLRLRARSRVDFGSSTEDIDIADEIARVDLGLAVGGGVELGHLVVDGRYTHGLRDVDKDETDAVTVTNRVVSITVGYRF